MAETKIEIHSMKKFMQYEPYIKKIEIIQTDDNAPFASDLYNVFTPTGTDELGFTKWRVQMVNKHSGKIFREYDIDSPHVESIVQMQLKSNKLARPAGKTCKDDTTKIIITVNTLKSHKKISPKKSKVIKLNVKSMF